MNWLVKNKNMEEQKQKWEMESWKLYTIHDHPEAQSHENWAVFALTSLSYMVLLTTWLT